MNIVTHQLSYSHWKWGNKTPYDHVVNDELRLALTDIHIHMHHIIHHIIYHTPHHIIHMHNIISYMHASYYTDTLHASHHITHIHHIIHTYHIFTSYICSPIRRLYSKWIVECYCYLYHITSYTPITYITCITSCITSYTPITNITCITSCLTSFIPLRRSYSKWIVECCCYLYSNHCLSASSRPYNPPSLRVSLKVSRWIVYHCRVE